MFARRVVGQFVEANQHGGAPGAVANDAVHHEAFGLLKDSGRIVDGGVERAIGCPPEARWADQEICRRRTAAPDDSRRMVFIVQEGISRESVTRRGFMG